MRFDWDEEKNIKNYNKHGVLFTEAVTVLNDPNGFEFLDDIYLVDEERYVRVGFSDQLRLLTVVFCENEFQQIVRIISCRKSTKTEERFYEKRI